MKLRLLSIILLCVAGSCDRLEYSPNQKFDKNSAREVNKTNLERLYNAPADDTIRFVLSGDSQRAYDDLTAFVDRVNSMSGVDFVVLNGDLSDFGLLQEFKWIEQLYSKIEAPHIGVIGNHDHVANGVDVYKRMYSQDLDFSFVYLGVKFVCHNTNSREYKFDGSVPNLSWLRQQMIPQAGVTGYVAIAHVPPTSGDFDKSLFSDYGRIFTDNGNVYAILNAHVDKETVQFPYGPSLPVITTNSIYNRKFLVVEIVNGVFSYYNVSF